MSMNPTDLTGQADAMRVIAELQDRAYNFGARLTPSWRFGGETGSIVGSVYTEQAPTPCEADAWRLAFDVAVTANPIPFVRESDGVPMISNGMVATYRGLRIEISMVHPRVLANVAVTA